jgi:hypothetical protein
MPGTIPLTCTGLTLLTGPDLVSVDSTSGGKTLATLLGANVATNLKQLKLIPAGTVYVSKMGENASASGNVALGAYPHVFHIRKHEADRLKFFASGATGMAVFQEG